MAALFAYIHSLAMIALGVMLFALFSRFERLQLREDVISFIRLFKAAALATVIMLASGAALLLLSAHGARFYLHNPVFWIKVAVFAAMLLIAITPVRIILHWDREIDIGTLPDPAIVAFLRRYLTIEAILFLLLPLAASLAARGIGLQAGAS